MIDYSIIIPSKNLPDLLQRALDSIPRRDGIQVIVVDDASDPGVVDFSAYPGLEDPQVEVVFTKEARGAGYARNAGLARAAGRWTLFLDCSQQYDYRTRKGDRKACLIDAEIIETLKACDINKMPITTLVNSILRAFIIQNQDILRQHLNKRNTLL